MKRMTVIVAGMALAALGGCGKKDGAAKTPEAADAAKPAAAVAPGPMAMPSRRPGLWVQTVDASKRVMTSSICFDAAMDKKMAVWGQQAGKDMCRQQSMTPVPGGWKFSSTCDMGPSGVIVSTGEAKGDFGSHYEVHATSVTTGSAMPQANGQHDMTITADWKGPCPANMKPGDMTLPGGMKINMLDMADAAPPRK